MKKLFITAMLACLVGVCAAQVSSAVEKTKSIKQEEVPALVMAAFQKELPNPPEGSWNIHFMESLNGNKTMLTPLSYSYKEAGRKGKTIVRFTPEGKVEYNRETEPNPDKNGK